MIDLYLCSTEDEGLRGHMAKLCQERWSIEPRVRVHPLTPKIAECSNADFQRTRRMYADEHADSAIYILADDDCLPQAKPFAEDAARVLDYYTEFRILSLRPVNAHIQPWTPEEYAPYRDTSVMEHVSVGGIRFCRKFVNAFWPPQHGFGYDMTQAEVIRRASRRVGYFRDFTMTHLGEGYSTVWNVKGAHG